MVPKEGFGGFPELAGSFPQPASSSAEDICSAAKEAALLLKRPTGETHAGLSPSQIQAVKDFPLDSPRWMEFSGAFTVEDGAIFSNGTEMTEWEEMADDSLWDP